MKLRQYLKEHCISVDEYKSLPEFDRILILSEFDTYNRKLQKQKQREHEFVNRQGWRPMTPEELKETEAQIAREMARLNL